MNDLISTGSRGNIEIVKKKSYRLNAAFGRKFIEGSKWIRIQRKKQKMREEVIIKKLLFFDVILVHTSIYLFDTILRLDDISNFNITTFRSRTFLSFIPFDPRANWKSCKKSNYIIGQKIYDQKLLFQLNNKNVELMDNDKMKLKLITKETSKQNKFWNDPPYFQGLILFLLNVFIVGQKKKQKQKMHSYPSIRCDWSLINWRFFIVAATVRINNNN